MVTGAKPDHGWTDEFMHGRRRIVAFAATVPPIEVALAATEVGRRPTCQHPATHTSPVQSRSDSNGMYIVLFCPRSSNRSIEKKKGKQIIMLNQPAPDVLLVRQEAKTHHKSAMALAVWRPGRAGRAAPRESIHLTMVGVRARAVNQRQSETPARTRPEGGAPSTSRGLVRSRFAVLQTRVTRVRYVWSRLS